MYQVDIYFVTGNQANVVCDGWQFEHGTAMFFDSEMGINILVAALENVNYWTCVELPQEE